VGKELVDSKGAEVVVQGGTELVRIGGELLPFSREYPHVTKGIALVHSGFNIVNVILFLPFTMVLARLLKRIVPDHKHKEAPHITRLDTRILETPTLGIEQSRVEILRMGASCEKMMEKLEAILAEPGGDHAERIRKLFHREEVLDIIQKEIVDFLTEMLADAAPHDVVEDGTRQMRMADELESVSDYIGGILKLHLRLHNEGGSLLSGESESILALHREVAGYMSMLVDACRQRNEDIVSKAKSQGDAITHRIRTLREGHLRRLAEERVPPLASVTFTNMLNGYRRVKDHMLNFAEAMAGQK
jgi:phosphate:Na+ symporter